MPAQFLLNLFIALLWMLLRDEDGLKIFYFFSGLPRWNSDCFPHASIFRTAILFTSRLFGNKAYYHFHIRAIAIKLLWCLNKF